MTPGSAARRSASRRGTRRSLWEDIEAVGKQATSLTPLIEVLAVSRQAEAASSTAPPPNLVVPKEFNFGGSIASTIGKPEVSLAKGTYFRGENLNSILFDNCPSTSCSVETSNSSSCIMEL